MVSLMSSDVDMRKSSDFKDQYYDFDPSRFLNLIRRNLVPNAIFKPCSSLRISSFSQWAVHLQDVYRYRPWGQPITVST